MSREISCIQDRLWRFKGGVVDLTGRDTTTHSWMPKIYKSVLPDLPAIPSGNAVAALFESPSIRNDGQKVILVDPVSKESLTNFQSAQITKKFAHLLRNKYGVRQGDVVTVFWPNSIWTRAVHQAILVLGAVVSPANVQYNAEELSHQLKITRSSLLITADNLYHTSIEATEKAATNTPIVEVSYIIAELRKLLHRDDGTPEVEPVHVDGLETPAYYCLSSGTSGLPKCVITTHTNIAVNMLQTLSTRNLFAIKDGVVGASLPMSHIFGLQVYLWASAYAGQKQVVFSSFQLEVVLPAIIEHKISVFAAVPPMILALANSPLLERYPVNDHLRFAASGAAPLSKSTIALLERKVPNMRVVQLYGMTESSPITISSVDVTPGEFQDAYDQDSVGWLVANTEARLVDPTTEKDVEDSKPGELWLRGPQIMKGYLNNKKATDETLGSDGWLRTGDVAIVSESNQFYIVDRIKELIKSKGYQVAPAELEALLLKDKDVADVAVIGVPDKDKVTELPRAYLVLRNATDPLDIVRRFNSTVAPYKQLWGGAVVIDVIPKSPSGKILRRFLRQRTEDTVVGAELANRGKNARSAKL